MGVGSSLSEIKPWRETRYSSNADLPACRGPTMAINIPESRSHEISFKDAKVLL